MRSTLQRESSQYFSDELWIVEPECHLGLSKGAAIGKFAHNTGEGGISRYHREGGGDLIWQIGTGYFGCRKLDGTFDESLYRQEAIDPQVKMIELKLSQGAKPGHGGILPAAKLTREIAEIRKVPMGKDVLSPPGHSAFSTPIDLLEFIGKLREKSGGNRLASSCALERGEARVFGGMQGDGGDKDPSRLYRGRWRGRWNRCGAAGILQPYRSTPV